MDGFSNTTRDQAHPDPLADPLDALLADIAVNVQLPPGLHAKANGRYGSVRDYIDRPGSPLEARVVQYYPQGSMAIDATTSTRGTDNEYDLDMVVEIDVAKSEAPGQVLDALWYALKDYPVQKVIRQTRCVTLQYSDGMHIDVTPSRRVPGTIPFESAIFHAKRGEPTALHFHVPMNAYGFAAWYNQRTPKEEAFSKAYNLRLLDTVEILAKADPVVHEVPEQVPLPLKSVTTVALQLVKRYRDIWSADRDGRYPPSVMLSCHAGLAASPGTRLSEMVVRQARWTAGEIDSAAASGRLVDVRNPVMRGDRFTDRWPENQKQQKDFATALKHLADGIDLLRQRRIDGELEDVQEWLRGCFGPLVVSRATQAFVARNGRALRGGHQGYGRSGSLYVPSAPAIVGSGGAVPSIVAPRRHTNMGERRP